MITDEKEKAHVMLKLLEIAWQNFDTRRSYEWKLNLAIWTTLAAFIALSLRIRFLALSASTQPTDITETISDQLKVVFVIVASVILLIQICFLYRVRRANSCDQNRALHYERLINKTLDVDFGPETNSLDNVQKSIKKVIGRSRLGGWWLVVLHVGITIALIIVALVTFL